MSAKRRTAAFDGVDGPARPPVWRRLGVMGACFLLVAGARPSAGYRLLFSSVLDPNDPPAAFWPSIQPTWNWDPEIWPPGETLGVILPDSPMWDVYFSDYDELRDFVSEQGLQPWAATRTADIRWEVVGPDSDLPTHAITITPHHHTASYGGVATKGAIPFVTIYECEVGVLVATEQEIESGVRDMAGRLKWLARVLRHELGHCLGLGHPAQYVGRAGESVWPFSGGSSLLDEWSSVETQWPANPEMSYGYTEGLTFDDRLGASFLRPRPGWIEQTGELIGRVEFEDGSPTKTVAVLAIRRRADGEMNETVALLTTSHGMFAIGGLPPGDYFLLARTDTSLVWSTYERARLVFDQIVETLLLRPVRVEAGARAGPVRLVVRRDVRVGPDAVR